LGAWEAIMSVVEVRDHALWAKHVHGADDLRRKIEAMPAGTLISLEVDGVKGTWKKMDDGDDGRPTSGIKPIGPAKSRWAALQAQRGALVSIKEV
jgi:hypothetical protein